MVMLLRMMIGAFGGVILAAGLRWLLGHFGMPPKWPDGTPVSWTIVIAAGAVLGAVNEAVQLLVQRRRRSRNLELAERQGWVFTDWVDPRSSEFRRTLSLFRRDSLQISMRTSGSFAERPMDIFDVSYSETTGSGKSRSTQTYVQTVYRFPGYGQTLCPFRLVPRSRMFRWLEGLLTSTESELHPPTNATEEEKQTFAKFRDQYQISLDSIGVDTNRAPQVFHPYVVAWFVLHPQWVMESDQQDLLVWCTGRVESGEGRFTRLEELHELLRLLDAGPQAAEALGVVQIERKPHDPASSLNRMFILFFGVVLGMMAGFFGGVVLFVALFPLIPEGPWKVPAFFAMFLVPSVIGIIAGFRFGYLHATGVPLAKPWEQNRG